MPAAPTRLGKAERHGAGWLSLAGAEENWHGVVPGPVGTEL